MKNQVIKVLSEEHGKKVIEYWKSKGVNTRTLEGSVANTYYGVVNEVFDNWAKLPPNTELITLPENKYPKVMWVSEDNLGWSKRVVFMEKGNKYLAWVIAETLEEAEYRLGVVSWKYAKDIEEPQIEEPQIIELTITDISKGKGVGIPPHLIRIKQ